MIVQKAETRARSDKRPFAQVWRDRFRFLKPLGPMTSACDVAYARKVGIGLAAFMCVVALLQLIVVWWTVRSAQSVLRANDGPAGAPPADVSESLSFVLLVGQFVFISMALLWLAIWRWRHAEPALVLGALGMILSIIAAFNVWEYLGNTSVAGFVLGVLNLVLLYAVAAAALYTFRGGVRAWLRSGKTPPLAE